MNDRIRAVALGNDPADLLLQNGRVVDVLTETIYEADVAIADGKIAGIGPVVAIVRPSRCLMCRERILLRA